MTDRELIQKALDALQKIYIAPEHEEYIRVWWPACEEAIKTLRDRLAQPDIESPASTTIKSELHRLHKENQALNKCLFQMQEAAKECSYPKCQATNGCVGACSNTAPPSIEAAIAAEREACADLCEEHFMSDGDWCAKRIRARSEK